mgnify:CR=1 FL=1
MAKAKGNEVGFIIPKTVRNKEAFISKGIGFLISDIKELIKKKDFDASVKVMISNNVEDWFEDDGFKEVLLPEIRPISLKNAEERKWAMEHDLVFGYSYRDGGESYKASCDFIKEKNEEIDKRIQACKDMIRISEEMGLDDIVKKAKKLIEVLEGKII